MNIKTLSIFTLTLIVFSACQSPANPRQSANLSPKEKAVVATQVSLEVKDPSQTKLDVIPDFSAATANIIVPPKPAAPEKSTDQSKQPNKTINLLVSDSGISPNIISAQKGDSLNIINSQDKQIELFTAEKGEACPVLGAIINIPGGKTTTIQLNKTFHCTIINQLNTSQKSVITVE